MSTVAEEVRVKPIVRLIDTRVVIDPHNNVTWGLRTAEERHRALESWAQEIFAFVRDHRSMDINDVRVERINMTICSGCEKEWEPYLIVPEDEDTPERTGKWMCANCGKLTESNR